MPHESYTDGNSSQEMPGPQVRRFEDLSQEGSIKVVEYETSANNYALLLSFGEQGPSIKISSEQGKELHSNLLRVYNVVQS